jgi:peptide-methionine (S)-S-oxide reductase
LKTTPKMTVWIRVAIVLALGAWLWWTPGAADTQVVPRVVDSNERAIATFAGGCFWCLEPPFDALKGVESTISGYTGGKEANPTYAEVSSGKTGHVEAMQVTYDPRVVTYEQLLEVFWKNIDPLDPDGQFCDKGPQYTTAIFYAGDEQKKAAEASLEKWKSSELFSKPIATRIVEASTFYPAEDYHQNYYKLNPMRYKFYRYSCGRDQRLEQVWGKSESESAQHE